MSDWCQACFDDRRTRLSQGAWFQCAGDFQHGVSICRGRGSWTWFGCPASSQREMSQCWLGTSSNFAIGVSLIIILMHSWNRPFAGALEQMILRYCSKILISLILFCLWTLEKTAAVSKLFMPNGGLIRFSFLAMTPKVCTWLKMLCLSLKFLVTGHHMPIPGVVYAAAFVVSHDASGHGNLATGGVFGWDRRNIISMPSWVCGSTVIIIMIVIMW